MFHKAAISLKTKCAHGAFTLEISLYACTVLLSSGTFINCVHTLQRHERGLSQIRFYLLVSHQSLGRFYALLEYIQGLLNPGKKA